MIQRAEDGFSLVEVIIALFLFSLLSLAVLPLLISGISLSASNRESVQTTALADAHIATLRAQYPEQPVTDTTCADLHTAVTKMLANDPSGPTVAVPAGFSRTIQVESCPTGAASGKPAALLVTVRITPSGGDAVELKSRIPVTKG